MNGPGAAAAANFPRTVTTGKGYAVHWFTKTGLPPATNAGYR